MSHSSAETTAAWDDGDLTKSRAVLVSRNLLVWDTPNVGGERYELRTDPRGQIAVVDGRLVGGQVHELAREPAGLPPDLAAKYPHLTGKPVYRLALDPAGLAEALRGQVVAGRFGPDGATWHATGVQLAPALDDLYRTAAAALVYGPVFAAGTPTLRVWAPTARQVRLRLFGTTPPAAGAAPSEVLDMTRDAASGTWSATGDAGWRGRYYQYEVTGWQPAADGRGVRTVVVTDPYSLALAVDSTHSQIVDLTEPESMPAGWSGHVPPGLGDNPAEHAITELHVRDFSIGDATVPAADRGTYRAFTHAGSAGMRHLRELAGAGMDTVHLLPTFDIGTVPERRADQRVPACDLPALPPDSTEQQSCVTAVAAEDGFNWGYDPWHYDVPEGSYATAGAQSGPARTREYREMVKSLHDNDIRVVVDVVYNHTVDAGDARRSVLDRIVPGYYHRLLDDGSIADSTCCPNTAPEHTMMGKLVVDSVLRWAQLYKVDGFRFDLMGHHPKANIQAVRSALDRLTVAADGVDGRGIHLYGEGWNFGEVADGARFVQATQANMAGTGVGTFNDRIRDGIRGGGPFDADPRMQGFASGLAGDPNGAPVNGTPAEQDVRLAYYTDWIRVGMAGNLAGFRFRTAYGDLRTGRDIDYNGSPAGYTAAPVEAVNYADAHDNETLYDALTYKLPVPTSMADRVRMQRLALAPVLLGQGQPFVLAGTEFLRSKSMDRNSYDSGDWFNRYDPTLAGSVFGSGLPPAEDNESKWSYARPLLADPALRPATADMRASVDNVLRLLRVRQSSPLFTLPGAGAVQQKLSYPDPGPDAGWGVLVAHLDDTAGTPVDPDRSAVVVVFNPRPTAQTVTLPAGGGWRLHAAQASDPDASRTQLDGDRATVVARSVVVLQR